MFFKKDKERLAVLETKIKQIDLFEEKIILLDKIIDKLVSAKAKEIKDDIDKKVYDCERNIANKVYEVISRIDSKFAEIKSQTKDDFREFKDALGNVKNEVDTKLIEFHKQITDKYFQTLEDIFRYNKEISLMNQLAKHIDDKDLAQLKTQLLQPVLEARWAKEKKEKGEAIEKNGEWVIEKRQRLHNQMLQMEKQTKPIAEIEAIKNQIIAFDVIIKKVQK